MNVVMFQSKCIPFWVLIMALVTAIACKKDDSDVGISGPEAVVKIDAFSFSGYQIQLIGNTVNAESISIQIADAYGNTVSSAFVNLNLSGDDFSVIVNAKEEKLYEGKLTVIVTASNEVSSKSAFSAIDFLPFANASYGLLYYNGTNKLLQARIVNGSLQNTIVPNIINENLLYVSSSYDPQLLFLDNGMFFHKRMSDSVAIDVQQGFSFSGSFLSAVEGLSKVYLSTTAGELFVFDKNLTSFEKVESQFPEVLENILVGQNKVALVYRNANDGRKFFEVRNTLGNQNVVPVQQYAFEHVFLDQNDNLIFVQKSEGGFFNFLRFNESQIQFEIIGNSAVFNSESSISLSNGFAFVGDQQSVFGLYTVDALSPFVDYKHTVLKGKYVLKQHRSLYASGILFQESANGMYSLETTTSFNFLVNLDFSLSANDVNILKPVFIVPN